MIWELINRLVGNFGYIILASFIMLKGKVFQESITDEIHTKREIIIVSAIFSILGIMGTCLGVSYKGSIVNIRNVSVVTASIIYGPLIGGIAGGICALHRFFYTGGVITAVPCSIATVIAGIGPGMIYVKSEKKGKYVFGVLSVISVESISIILTKVVCNLDKDTIASIYIPMLIINSISYCMMVSILDTILKEKDRIEGNQAKLTLEIANKTIPYFKNLDSQSLITACETIRESLDAEVVALTDLKHIMAYSSRNDEAKIYSKDILSSYTKKAIKSKKPVILNDNNEKIFFYFDKKNVIKSAIITPLIFDNEIIGTLKVYFSKSYHITDHHKNMVLGLASIVSTELQLGKIKEYENMANKAEIRALQTQINPHFLFNALNTITSFVRVNPIEARELIVNLAQYLRYNLEFKDDFIELKNEINQVNSFVAIEKARFPGKFEVHYEISDEDMNIKIPPLTIEPLVENAIKHGILKKRTGKNVYVRCIKKEQSRIIVIEDDGCGIDEKIINHIYKGNLNSSKVGLYNVYSRLKLIYGTSLNIEKLKNGTRISFEI